MPYVPSISRMKSLQSVLSQTRNVICDVYGISEADAFTRVQAFIEVNSERWKQADPNINYEDPFCRMAYLYMNVAVHATLVEQAMSHYSEIRRSIEDKARHGSDIEIGILGGGPGSELLGIVRYIESLQLGMPVHLDLVLVDKIKEWDESWHALKSGIDNELKSIYGDNRGNWPVLISRSFLPLDITSEQAFSHFATRFSKIDLFLASYLVSELKSSTEKISKVFQLLVTRGRSDVLVLFVDRDEKAVRDAVQEIIGDLDLHSLGLVQVRGELKDQLQDLGEWYINIPFLPRQRWLAFFHLAKRLQAENR
jgi:hypothetical protein